MCRRPLLQRALATLLLLVASSTVPAAESAEQLEQVAPGRVVPIELNPPVPPEPGGEVVLLPVPDSSPTIGTGLRLVGAYLFGADVASQPSVLGAAAGYYDSRTWFAGLGGNINVLQDRWRITAGIGVVEVNYDFYGVGTVAGGGGIKFPIKQSGTAGVFKVLRRIGSNFYLGAGYRYLDSRVGLQLPGTDLPPQIEETLRPGVRVVSSGPILAASYDTRDLNTNPRTGSYIALEAIFPRQSLPSSDRSYQRVRFSANHYLPLGRHFTLGARLTLCSASADTPFFDLCLFGSSGDLRGYAVGQYQDRSMFALQSELRAQLLPRWGGVIFAGAGQVAPSFGSMNSKDLLTSTGFGIRWMAAPKSKVNLRADVAWREGGESALYVSIGEAF